jgi:hypothetical protein
VDPEAFAEQNRPSSGGLQVRRALYLFYTNRQQYSQRYRYGATDLDGNGKSHLLTGLSYNAFACDQSARKDPLVERYFYRSKFGSIRKSTLVDIMKILYAIPLKLADVLAKSRPCL